MITSYKFKKITKIAKYGLELETIRAVKRVDNKFIGSWMRDKLIALGPTYIKIGQFLSTRKDIFGQEFTDELKQLQDNVPPFSYECLLAEIKDFKDNFQYIDPTPLAAASIGQVHKATLKDGKEVVIKARRPKIKDNIKEDFELVMAFLSAGKNLINSQRLLEINILFEEYYKLLIEEIDFKNEMENMKQFSNIFKDTSWIKIPYVYEKYCNDDVITMEYVPSTRLDNISNARINRQLIADKLMECYIKQIIDNGIVHIDPHNGNLGLTQQGKIVFYDYGMVLRLDPKIRDNFNDLLLAIYEKDVNEICKIAINLDLVVITDKDIPSFKRFLYYFLEYINTLDVNDFKVSYLDKIDQSNLNFMLSSKFIMLLRGITILEGVCKDLDPKFNYMRTLEPYVNDFMFNIDYIEKKAQKDLFKLFNGGDQSKEIEIEMVQSSIQKLEKNVTKTDIKSQALTLVPFVFILYTIIYR
jgi:ubiquinone biosynthesis protein